MGKFKSNFFKTDAGFVVHRHYEIEQNTDSAEKVKVTGNNHHVFVIDASGSMYYDMDNIATRFVELTKTKLIKDDTLTVILFNQDFRTVFQQFLITENVDDYIETISKNKKQFYASGLTGFAKPINHLIDGDVIPMLKMWAQVPIKLYFMSDGYDNQSGSLQNILDAFSKIRDYIKVGNTHVEGFGEYYDKDALTAIAKHMNGIFVHTHDVDTYMSEIETFVDNREKGSATKVEIPDYGEFTFVLNKEDGSIIMIEQGKKEFEISASDFMVVTYITRRPADMKKVSVLDENSLQAAYAASIVASRSNMLDVGVDILSNNVKDSFFAEVLDVALTPNLFAAAETMISSAVIDPTQRFQDGNKKYLKDPNRPDVMAILNMIASDDGSDGNGVEIQKPISYSPISFRPVYLKEQENGRAYGKFINDGDGWAKLRNSNLVFDDKTCNLNIQFNEKGYVEVDSEDVMEHNLQPKVKDIYKFTRYTLFDGKGSFRFKDKKGVNAIFIRNITQKLYDDLRTVKAIHGSASYAPNKVFRIRLTSFPVINRSNLDEIKSADYGALIAAQQTIQIENRVLKHFYEVLKPAAAMEARFGTEEAEALKIVAGVDGSGSYRAKSKELNSEIAKQILDAMAVDYDSLLPEYTTKKDAGKKKPYEALTANEIKQLLVDANLISSEFSFKFDGKLNYVVDGQKPVSFNSISSLGALKSNLILKGNFIIDYLDEKDEDGQKLMESVLVDAGKKANAKPTKAHKEALLEKVEIDIDSLTFEIILNTKAGLKASEEITNFSEMGMLIVLNGYLTATENLNDAEKVAYLENIFEENKAKSRDISFSKFSMKLAFIIGKKGFTDQPDRFNPIPVKVVMGPHTFEFTPSVIQDTLFVGSLQQLLDRAGITLQ